MTRVYTDDNTDYIVVGERWAIPDCEKYIVYTAKSNIHRISVYLSSKFKKISYSGITIYIDGTDYHVIIATDPIY